MLTWPLGILQLIFLLKWRAAVGRSHGVSSDNHCTDCLFMCFFPCCLLSAVRTTVIRVRSNMAPLVDYVGPHYLLAPRPLVGPPMAARTVVVQGVPVVNQNPHNVPIQGRVVLTPSGRQDGGGDAAGGPYAVRYAARGE